MSKTTLRGSKTSKCGCMAAPKKPIKPMKDGDMDDKGCKAPNKKAAKKSKVGV